CRHVLFRSHTHTHTHIHTYTHTHTHPCTQGLLATPQRVNGNNKTVHPATALSSQSAAWSCCWDFVGMMNTCTHTHTPRPTPTPTGTMGKPTTHTHTHTHTHTPLTHTTRQSALLRTEH